MDPFSLFVFPVYLCHSVTCCDRAELLVILSVIFFVTFLNCVLGQAWYLIVSFLYLVFFLTCLNDSIKFVYQST